MLPETKVADHGCRIRVGFQGQPQTFRVKSGFKMDEGVEPARDVCLHNHVILVLQSWWGCNGPGAARRET